MTAVCIIVGVCLALEAFFSGAELALLSADRIQLRARANAGGKRGRLIGRFLDRPSDLIATSLIGTTLCVVVSSVVVTLSLISRGEPHAELLSIGVMTPLILVFGEIVPKSIFQAHADTLAPRAIYLLWAFYAALSPIVIAASRFSDIFLRALGIHERQPFMTRQELRLLLQIQGNEHAEPAHPDRISEVEKRMIARIFEFSEKSVSTVMLPLSEVCALPTTASLDEATREFLDKRYTRMPIYGQRVDEIEGVVHAFDLLRAPADAQALADVARPPVFVPESQPAAQCLERLQRERQGMAIVVNEYGGAVGVVTTEDIFEEVVGEIEDEYDAAAPALVLREGPGVWRIQGRATVAFVNQELRLGLPESDEYETLAGLVLHQLKHIPRAGERIRLPSAMIAVIAASDRSVEELRVEAPKGRSR